MAIVQTGSTIDFVLGGTSRNNTGTASSTITVPSDAELVVAGISGFDGTANFFSTGGMTFTKGGADTAMTAVGGGDANTSLWMGAMFYLVLPDTGTNKTLKWDWLGAGSAADDVLISISFWKGVDTASPVRGTGGGQAASAPFTTGTITAVTGDLIIAFAAIDVTAEGTVASWTNLSLVSQCAHNNAADGAWASGSPTGNTTVTALTTTNASDGAIVAASFKAAAAGAGALVAPLLFSPKSLRSAGRELLQTLAPASLASGGVNANVTGVEAASAVNTPTVTGFANVTLTGVNATSAVNTVTVAAKANTNVTGVAGTASAGTLDATGKANVTLTGVAATAQVNTPTVTGLANVTLTGVNATAAAGDVTVSLANGVSVTLTGVAATAAVGTPTVTGAANVTLTGVNATASVGTLSISGKATATLTGVLASTAVNAPTITAAANVTLTGVAATGAVNTPTVTGFANVTLTGVAGTAQVGTLTVTAGGAVSAALTGVAATAAVGTLNVTGAAIVSLTGVSGTALPGDVTVTTGGPVSVSVTLDGVSAIGRVGTLTVVEPLSLEQGGRYRPWPIKSRKKLLEEELKELEEQLKAANEAAPKPIYQPVVYQGPLSAIFFEQIETLERRRSNVAVKEMIARAKADAQRRLDEDEEAILLLLI